MHLADYDGALVTNQVWTDLRQIEERLADLAVHMETVTQKYLRNEYATIEEYNAVAEEVAEPYRVLVVADFPSKFDEKSAARLAAIAAGGVPCGVLTLVAADISKPLPPGFQLDELRPYCARLPGILPPRAWSGTTATSAGTLFPSTHLRRQSFPPARSRKSAPPRRDAKRVEVPFEFISPPAGVYWTHDSRSGIDVPLGKAGATKRQHFTLGHGTSQHVLIAGRTGSGKSTLMHALITNLALNYSPDEIDLYLIDFKKGVEFKVYATHELPHASVVAIESEREFGISVLERLDAELRLRADRFRDAGVQDLAGYRNTAGTPPLPRILLIVDEFQEFFSEEDKLAQEAALWLDRLVRQGRAFGIHIILGSQSLGGAFTLARSTLGQMAVRIALQCSENDAHLILSENNIAPRMLSRPARRSTTTPMVRPKATTSSRSSGSRKNAANRISSTSTTGRSRRSQSCRGHPSSLKEMRPPIWPATNFSEPAWKPQPGPNRLARRRPGWARPSRSRTRRRHCSDARERTIF